MTEIICLLLSVVCTWSVIGYSIPIVLDADISSEASVIATPASSDQHDFFVPEDFMACYESELNSSLLSLEAEDAGLSAVRELMTVEYGGIDSQISAVVYKNKYDYFQLFFIYEGDADPKSPSNTINIVLDIRMTEEVRNFIDDLLVRILYQYDSTIQAEELITWLNRAENHTYFMLNEKEYVSCVADEQHIIFTIPRIEQ